MMKNYPQTATIRRWFMHVLFAVVSLLAYHSQTLAQSPNHLSDLTNDALLKQASEILNTAQLEYQKELRKYYNQERIYQESAQQLNKWQTPDTTFQNNPGEQTTLAATKLYTNHISKLLNHYQQKASWLQNKYQVLQEMVIQIDAIMLAGNKSKSDLVTLMPYLFEIKLRLKDATMKALQMPKTLSEKNIKTQQQALNSTIAQFKSRVETIKQKIADLTKVIVKNKEIISKTEFQLLAAKEKQANVQKNVALKNTYAIMSPKKLLRTFAELVEEKNWIKGSYQMAYRKVLALAKTATALFKDRANTKTLTTKDLSQMQDLKQGLKTLDELLKRHLVQSKKREELQAKLAVLLNNQEAFKGEAAIINEQVSKMVFIAQLIKSSGQEGKLNPQSVLPANWYASITAEEKQLIKQNAEVVALGQQAKNQLELVQQEITYLKLSQEKLIAQKKSFQRKSKSLEKVVQWKAAFKNMAPDKLTIAFNTLADDLTSQQKLLENYYKKYKNAEDIIRRLKREMNTLKGPLFRQIKRNSSEDKYGIRAKLYALINKKAMREERRAMPIQQKPDSSLAKIVTEKEEKKGLFKSLVAEKYSHLLARHIGIIQKRKHLKDSLKKSLDTLLTHLHQFIVKRNEINALLLKQNLYAKQIKKLFGQQKIPRSEVPVKINEALKYEQISSFEALTRELYDLELSVQQELKTLAETKETNALQAHFITLQKNTGSRSSLHRQLEELQEAFEQKKKKLSGTALKVSEQLAVNRLSADNSFEDFFLGFIKSADTKNYSKILTANYVELIQLEQQQSILQTQIHKLEKLTRLEYIEKDSIPVLLGFLQQRLKQLELANEEAWIKVKMRLIPEKAQELVQAFQVKTKRNILPLAPVEPGSRDSLIRVSTQELFDYYVEIAAVKKWIQLLQERQTTAGIEQEIDAYASIIGELEAKKVSIQKSIEELTGHPETVLEKMDLEERPQTRLAMLTFLKGKIGALRATRNRLRYKSLLYLVVQLLFIVVLAYLLIWAVKSTVNRIVVATEEANEPTLAEESTPVKTQARVVRVFARVFRKRKRANEVVTTELEWLKKAEFLPMLYFVKALLIVAIWVFAITLSVETLGFNAGAILAGLGIGGFALAFALKDILADLFGGLTLVIAKPFKVGHWILFKGSWTKVLKVGMRYTKLLRDADSKTVTVPNAMLTSAELVNLSTYSGYIGRGEVKITPQNSYEKFELAIELIQQVFEEISDEVTLAWVRNDGFKDYSFVIKYRYTVLAISTRNKNVTYIHTKIIEQFQANNIEFAHPPSLPLVV